jgi:UDP-2,3-diacylglucosamine pyrophosphatase LpxH
MEKIMSKKHQRLSEVLSKSDQIEIDNESRLILFSDIHRGDNSWADEFTSTKTLYAYALEHYLREGYIYIEVGDGDELIKNSNPKFIQRAHFDIYQILRDFYLEDRFYSIHGNHDILYKEPEYTALHLSTIINPSTSQPEILFPGISIHEGLLLEHQPSGGKILVTHGHQGELLNDRIWKMSRFLLRFFWRPLQMIGIRNPFRVSHNPDIRRDVEAELINWSRAKNQPLLCGHTHCAYLSTPGETAYFNTGCCVHPLWITGIEIDRGSVMLIRWRVKPDQKGSLIIQQEILAGPHALEDYFPGYRINLDRPQKQVSVVEEAFLTWYS